MEPPGTPADAEVNGEANTTGSTNSIIEGLTVLWGPNYRDASTPGPPVMVPDFDVVIIHGLHGTLQDPWTSPGSGSSRWLPDAGEGEGRRVMSFGYDASKILAGALTRQAIRKTALSLLNALKAERGDKGAPYTTRSIMFIAHDIGGIILKDALTVAGLKPASYGDIFDFSRVLVFYGCPHWAVDYMDMEDVIAPFIFCHLSENPALVTASVHSVRGLARAIVDINSLFIDIKHIFRSYVISVFAGDINSSSVYQTFDSFHATLGMPFETRVSGGVSTDLDGGVIEKHLIKIQPQVSVDTRTLVYERNLLAIAAPMPSLFSNDTLSHPFSWISENKTYTSWLKQKQPQLLYVYGTTRVRDAAEYIFYDLDRAHQENNNQIVLYFTFNRWDVRRDTIQDMLTCFLAQIIGHFPRLADFVLAQFKRLGEDRSWNDFDLLNWFEYYRLRGEVEGISCVIDRFDQCDEQSREAFFSLISGLAKVHERPWQVVVTSQEPKALSKELSEWPQLDLDSAGGPRQRPAPVRQISASMLAWLPETRSIVQRRPELRGCEPEIQAEILSIDALKHNRAIRNLVLEHMSAQAGWPTRESIKSTLGDVTVMSPEEILNRILDNIPDKKFTELALSWILYSVRAPTVWELATALFYSLDHPDKPDLVPTQEYVDETISRVTA
ncbi:hypothetical protein GQ53DRAFT_840942 [Thozetella sp. PMI_491]|nr:hypothetical protein GQ53DRAFT_840942 [Thozetella sp. PMI_491]